MNIYEKIDYILNNIDEERLAEYIYYNYPKYALNLEENIKALDMFQKLEDEFLNVWFRNSI